MELFHTIGNATLLVEEDDAPLLVCDPWIQGSCYWGSWGPLHQIPSWLYSRITAAPFVFLSHGHPDHSPHESVERLKGGGRTILLPDHVGGRMARELRALGHQVSVLPDRRWVRLSDAVSVCAISDYFQDGILLVNFRNRVLLANINDAADRGAMEWVKKVAADFEKVVLLKLFNPGDVDMANFWVNGKRCAPESPGAQGEKMASFAEWFGATDVVPFSAMHRLQRADSVWAEDCGTPLEVLTEGFHSQKVTLHPPYQSCNVDYWKWQSIKPPLHPDVVLPPEHFGDCWDERLTPQEAIRLQAWGHRFETLSEVVDHVEFEVGGIVHPIQSSRWPGQLGRALRFKAPRGSLMSAVDLEIFDDMLIGNFMETHLLGKWDDRRLYPDFSPTVGKFGDNGRAFTGSEVDKYLREYKRRDAAGFIRHAIAYPVSTRIRRIAKEGQAHNGEEE